MFCTWVDFWIPVSNIDNITWSFFFFFLFSNITWCVTQTKRPGGRYSQHPSIDSKQRPSHVHKFSDLLLKGFQKDAFKTTWIQYISYMKDTVKRTTGQRAFLLHMLFGVVLRLPFQSVMHATVANSVFNRVSLGVRSLVSIYILRNSIKGHSTTM